MYEEESTEHLHSVTRLLQLLSCVAASLVSCLDDRRATSHDVFTVDVSFEALRFQKDRFLCSTPMQVEGYESTQ